VGLYCIHRFGLTLTGLFAIVLAEVEYANDQYVLRDTYQDVFKDIERHHLPHIHAEYQGDVAVYSIEDGAVLPGNIPQNKHKLVVAWIEIHKEDLFADWELAVNGRQPFKIKGLDQ